MKTRIKFGRTGRRIPKWINVEGPLGLIKCPCVDMPHLPDCTSAIKANTREPSPCGRSYPMVLLILALLFVLTLLRMWSILPHKARRLPLKSSKPTRSLAAFLGSGKWTIYSKQPI